MLRCVSYKATTLIARIEADHTIKVPTDLPVGEQVLVVRMPSMQALLKDDARRTRFAATRKAIQNAIAARAVVVALALAVATLTALPAQVKAAPVETAQRSSVMIQWCNAAILSTPSPANMESTCSRLSG